MDPLSILTEEAFTNVLNRFVKTSRSFLGLLAMADDEHGARIIDCARVAVMANGQKIPIQQCFSEFSAMVALLREQRMIEIRDDRIELTKLGLAVGQRYDQENPIE